MTLKNLTTYATIIFLLVACGPQGAERTKSPASDIVPASSPELSAQANAAQRTDTIVDNALITTEEAPQASDAEVISSSVASHLNGSWTSACDPVDGNSVIVSFELSDTMFSQKIEYFSGINCSQLLMTGLDSFEFTLSDGTINADNLISFNLVQKSSEFTIARQELIRTVNNESWFDYNDWEATVTKDVSGRAIATDRTPKLNNGDEATSNFIYSEKQILIEDRDGDITILNKIEI